jgi:hypothetical protein
LNLQGSFFDLINVLVADQGNVLERPDHFLPASGLFLHPAAGLIFCLTIWFSSATPAAVAGADSFVLGIIDDAIITRGR